MNKLLKYEFFKIRGAIIIVLSIVIVLEAMFSVGAVLMKFNDPAEFDGTMSEYYDSSSYVFYSIGQNLFTFSVAILLIACFSAFALVIIFSLVTMNNDFSKKQGYNVFLTPNSSYAILGSKYITTVSIFVIYVVLCILFVWADVNIICWLEGDDYFSIVEEVLIPVLEETGVNFAAMIASIVCQVLFYIVLAGFTMILAQTIIKTSGALKLLLEFGIFIGINAAVSTIIMIPSAVYSTKSAETMVDSANALYIVCIFGYGIACALLYFLSARLIDRKLSL